MDPKNCNCVITGVSGATGSAIRAELLKKGATVIGTVRPKHIQTLTQVSPNDYQIGMDPLNRRSIDSAITQISQQLTQVHVWVNIIGGFDMGSLIEDYSTESWERMYALNYLTVLNSSQAIIPHFKTFQSGRLINFGSAAVAEGMAQAAPYLVSKGAVHSLTKACASELNGDITCNAILPTIIDTKANRDAMPDADFSEWVLPETIASQISKLISNQSNGALIQI